jgi:hypothetical protein
MIIHYRAISLTNTTLQYASGLIRCMSVCTVQRRCYIHNNEKKSKRNEWNQQQGLSQCWFPAVHQRAAVPLLDYLHVHYCTLINQSKQRNTIVYSYNIRFQWKRLVGISLNKLHDMLALGTRVPRPAALAPGRSLAVDRTNSQNESITPTIISAAHRIHILHSSFFLFNSLLQCMHAHTTGHTSHIYYFTLP